ncbi:hypothetical protein QBC46DRAFT_58634 [Diplogelasinospora grovesii]|uniref:Uncharacterized protein n=1 Tax=Diplogelasinospora grovesii TaxID=303347 RepID=A0AAN6MXX1_9PEZI|nr:hypothetical protein QBC46DRAFT_58634 [Diplogelasinospora grovesii]
MGANLSSTQVVDTSKDIISPTDRQAEIILGVAWLGSLYGIAMIWCAVNLLQRWAGPHGERGVNFFSILAAFLLSTGWPVVLVYLCSSSR